MVDWIDLKEVWQSAEVEGLPDAKEAVRLVKRYRRRTIFKKTAMIFLLLLMAGLVVFVLFYGGRMITTQIGALGFLIGISILLISNLNSLKRALRNANCSNREFLEYLLEAQRGRDFFYRRVQPIIFLLLVVSWFLLFYESLSEKPRLMAGVYFAFAIYFTAIWFYIRRRIIKNHSEKLRKTIQKFESFSE